MLGVIDAMLWHFVNFGPYTLLWIIFGTVAWLIIIVASTLFARQGKFRPAVPGASEVACWWSDILHQHLVEKGDGDSKFPYLSLTRMSWCFL